MTGDNKKSEVLIRQYRFKLVHRYYHCNVCEQRLQFDYSNLSKFQITEFPYCITCGARFKKFCHTLQ